MSPSPLQHVMLVEAIAAGAPIALRLAAAMTGRIAADLGARVVVLDDGGDPLGALTPQAKGGGSAAKAFLSAGKQVVIDAPARRAELYAAADAIVTDTERVDVTGAQAIQVVLSMVPGERRPEPPHSEFTILALSGMLDVIGDPDGTPQRLGGHQLAYAAGLAAYAGLSAALLRRPEPETVRVALLEVAIWLNWKSIASAAIMNAVPHRAGRASEWPVVRCADGYVAVVYQPDDWPALRRLCGDERLAQERFATASARRGHALELADIIETSLSSYTRRELQDRALSLRLPLGPVWRVDEVAQEPHMTARGFFAGPDQAPRFPMLWNGQPLAAAASAVVDQTG